MTNLVRTETLGKVAINPKVHIRVQEALDNIERLYSVRTLLAAESGSRLGDFRLLTATMACVSFMRGFVTGRFRSMPVGM